MGTLKGFCSGSADTCSAGDIEGKHSCIVGFSGVVIRHGVLGVL